MSITIASTLSGTTSAAGPSLSPAAALQVQAVRQTTAPQVDTVKLSTSQQVYQLHLQGQRVSQIASALNLSEAAVNSYLNLSNKTG